MAGCKSFGWERRSETPAVGRKAGNMILFHKNLDFTINKQRAHGEGRKRTIDITIGMQSLTISNIYAPNVQTAQSFQDIAQWLATVSKPFELVRGILITS